ncbi:hypothetical protein [uncultured Sphingomonas sp.]|uniref:hypothetical protein n=1 Tax=uncultured Sphingomonas sp. TaxID=158754 RepID=UPI0035CC0833
MPLDKFDLLGPALRAVGDETMRIVGGTPDGVLLYVEIGEGWVSPDIFKDEGSSVTYVDIGESRIWQLLIEAWCLEPEDKRWTTMNYTIDHGKFDAQFDFDDLEGSGEDSLDRRERVLRARFGDKPVVYPPPSPHAWTLKPPA